MAQNIVRRVRPPHRGALVASMAAGFSLSQQQVTTARGMGRATVYRLMRGKRSVTPEMALRLARAFSGSPGVWMRMQLAVDLWDAEHNEKAKEIEAMVHQSWTGGMTILSRAGPGEKRPEIDGADPLPGGYIGAPVGQPYKPDPYRY